MHVVEHQRAARLARSLAIRNRALKVQIFETDTKLNACLREMHGHMDVVLRTAEERLDALEAAHAEMDMLRQELARRDTALKTLAGAARERLQALEAAHAEMDRLRRQIEQMRTS
jgi:septal ring factor EnvC (AmiA/AmiB activator)